MQVRIAVTHEQTCYLPTDSLAGLRKCAVNNYTFIITLGMTMQLSSQLCVFFSFCLWQFLARMMHDGACRQYILCVAFSL